MSNQPLTSLAPPVQNEVRDIILKSPSRSFELYPLITIRLETYFSTHRLNDNLQSAYQKGLPKVHST